MSPRKAATKPSTPATKKATAAELVAMVNATLQEKGKPPVIRLASDEQFVTKYIPTGLLPLDILLQGGIPVGRFIELFGDYSTLKSYIGYNACREFQQRGMVPVVIDTEHSFDAAWAASLGVDVDNLIIERPATGELAIDLMEALIRGGADFILVDSISTLMPEAEQKKRLSGESLQPARLAQLMSAGLRRLTAANTHTSVIWINQTRVNIGITFGSNEARTGGKAMPYYASYIVGVRKTGKITRDAQFFDGQKWTTGKEQIGQKFKAEVIKSKLSKPFREIWFDWNLEGGQIDLPAFLISQGVELGFITITGNTWTYGDLKVVGREKFKAAFSADPMVMWELEDAVRRAHELPLIPKPEVKRERATTKKAVQARKPMRKGLKK